MIKEIYIRTPEDPYYSEGIIDFTNEAEEIITQIKILLGTAPGDVLCAPNFGIDLEYLVFKTKKAAAELSRQVSSRRITKQYYAMVEGCPRQEEGELTDYLVRDGRTNTSRVTSEKDPQAKRAVLSYQVMKKMENKSLLLITLHTGRHHQIRVQLAHAGFPVVGDRKYGLRSSGSPYMPLGLCSCRLNFVHPASGKEMEFTICPEGQAFAGVTPWLKRLPEKP